MKRLLLLAAICTGWCSIELVFNLRQDIGETRNVADEHPEVVARLIEIADRYVRDGRSTPGKKQSNEGETRFLPKGYLEKERDDG